MSWLRWRCKILVSSAYTRKFGFSTVLSWVSPEWQIKELERLLALRSDSLASSSSVPSSASPQPSPFDAELDDLLASLLPDSAILEKRQAFLKRLQAIVDSLPHSQCTNCSLFSSVPFMFGPSLFKSVLLGLRLEPFGSAASGISTKDSDFDVCVSYAPPSAQAAAPLSFSRVNSAGESVFFVPELLPALEKGTTSVLFFVSFL